VSDVSGIGSMRYANETLHCLVRHERHWRVHVFSLMNGDTTPQLIPQRRIDVELVHLRFAGENFQMEVLPDEQGWLVAIQRSYLVHLDYDGKNGQSVCVHGREASPSASSRF
jgi:hypothetical protein